MTKLCFFSFLLLNNIYHIVFFFIIAMLCLSSFFFFYIVTVLAWIVIHVYHPYILDMDLRPSSLI